MLALLPRTILAACVAVSLPFASLSAQASADSAGVSRAMMSFLDALNTLDLAGMTSFFADDVTAFVPSAQAGEVSGKAAVTEIFRVFVETSRKVANRKPAAPMGLSVQASGDLGFASFSVSTATGVVRRRTFIWKRTGSGWRIAHFHASDVSRPA